MALDGKFNAGSKYLALKELNYSSLTPGEVHSPQEDQFYLYLYRVVVPILFATIVTLGVLGNFLVIYVIISRKAIRNVTNILLMNLAFADLSFLAICGTFSAVHYAITVWPFGDLFCRVIQYLMYTTCYVTVYTLVAISVVRYVSVVHGGHHYITKSNHAALCMIVTIWVVFLLAKSPTLVVHGVTASGFVENRTECIISGRREGQELFATFFVFAYALPLAIIATLYFLIISYLWKRKQSPDYSPNYGGGCSRTRQVTRSVTVIVLVFAMGWLPLHIHLLVAYYGTVPDTRVYSVFIIVCNSLIILTSIVNPIIYNCFSQDFREAFKEIICQDKTPTTPVHV